MQSLFASLTDYIPIIQLFIGNGPLVYLQKKFENPTTDIHDTLTDKYQKFFHRYQGALHDQERHLNTALRNDKDWLINAGGSITALAISSFVYCMLLMVYAIEEYMFDLDKVAGALFVVAVVYFIYNAIILIGFGQSMLQFFRNW